jgi:hypothetical protein
LYVSATGDLFVNCLYDAAMLMADELAVKFPEEGDTEEVRALAEEAAQRSIMLLVGRAVVFALAKRNSEAWSADEMHAALDKVCLSIAADNYRPSLHEAARYIRAQLRARQAAA